MVTASLGIVTFIKRNFSYLHTQSQNTLIHVELSLEIQLHIVFSVYVYSCGDIRMGDIIGEVL